MKKYYGLSQSAKQKALDFIDLLQEKFPRTFPKKPDSKVPLMIGIHEQLLLIKDELGVEEKTIINAMKLWCKGARYYTVLSVAGVPRLNLNGEQVGLVTEK
jgi:ProP effector